MPYQGTPLQPFRPCNGTAGMIFEEAYCARCTHEDAAAERWCEIATNAMAYGLEDEHYPREWVFGVDGWPTCTAFRDRNSEPDAPAYVSPDPGQGDLFEPLPVVEVSR